MDLIVWWFCFQVILYRVKLQNLSAICGLNNEAVLMLGWSLHEILLFITLLQHDMPQAQLKTALDSTVEECVSFVGVDINTCSECLLR